MWFLSLVSLPCFCSYGSLYVIYPSGGLLYVEGLWGAGTASANCVWKNLSLTLQAVSCWDFAKRIERVIEHMSMSTPDCILQTQS